VNFGPIEEDSLVEMWVTKRGNIGKNCKEKKIDNDILCYKNDDDDDDDNGDDYGNDDDNYYVMAPMMMIITM
jgi:hypothetical protein